MNNYMQNKCCNQEKCIHIKGRCKKCGVNEYWHKRDGYAYDHEFIIRDEDKLYGKQ